MGGGAVLIFELGFFAFSVALLLVQNFNVYHVGVVTNGDFFILAASLLVLLVRPLWSTVTALQRVHPLELPSEYVGAGAVLLAHLFGLAAWLLRHLLDRQPQWKLALLVGLPMVLWLVPRPYEVVQQMLLVAYVVGALPPVFASPHLFFDRVRCGVFAVSAALSSGTVLGIWTLRSHWERLQYQWCLLGAWERRPGGAAAEPWKPHQTYATGAVVSYQGHIWEAVGPHDSNMSRPGSRKAAWLQLIMGGGNVLRGFDVAIAVQIAIVLFHAASAALRAHYLADMVVAFIHYPVILMLLAWRRQVVQKSSNRNLVKI